MRQRGIGLGVPWICMSLQSHPGKLENKVAECLRPGQGVASSSVLAQLFSHLQGSCLLLVGIVL